MLSRGVIKTMLVLVLLSLLLVLCSAPYRPEFRCLFYKGECVSRCPRNMHPYHTRCDLDAVSQRTCVSRYVYPLGFTCGWSRCDCNGELLLDEESWRCVPEEECPILGRRRKSRRRLHLPKGGGSEEMITSIG